MELVELDKIRIQRRFKLPKIEKLQERRDFYKNNNKFKVPIILTKKYVLVDGYTTYLVAKEHNITEIDVIIKK